MYSDICAISVNRQHSVETRLVSISLSALWSPTGWHYDCCPYSITDSMSKVNHYSGTLHTQTHVTNSYTLEEKEDFKMAPCGETGLTEYLTEGTVPTPDGSDVGTVDSNVGWIGMGLPWARIWFCRCAFWSILRAAMLFWPLISSCVFRWGGGCKYLQFSRVHCPCEMKERERERDKRRKLTIRKIF